MFEIIYRFNDGEPLSITKRADSEKRARRALYRQLGSRYVEILKIKRVAA